MNSLDSLYGGDLRAVLVEADGAVSGDIDASGVVVLAGSFNPLHDGHRKLLEVARRISGRCGMFEISIANVDKPDLPRHELEQRLLQFEGIADVAVTRAPLFSDKAKLLPGAWFVLGHDTAVRLVDDSYYPSANGGTGAATSDLKKLQAAGVRFLVAGRVSPGGEFLGLESLDIPEGLTGMFIEIPEAAFRSDVSSTDLRRGQAH